MRFKLIIVMVQDDNTDVVVETARNAGATGCTVITSARGEGLQPAKTFLGLTLEGQRDIVMLIVEEHLSRAILEAIARKCRFDEEVGAGLALQVDIEDAIGMGSQITKIRTEIGDKI
ncbi:MAG: P-II family nitrogen regulator [Hyphomicrobiaceae bacterium]|jgi:nitrogen regulatory protein PII